MSGKRTAVPLQVIQGGGGSSNALDELTGVGQVRLVSLPLADLYAHPDNPRRDLGDLTELAASIEAQGLQQPLMVVPYPETDNAYRIVIGHRRAAAAQLVGLDFVPAIVRDLSPLEQRELMLVENLQRSDLSPVEEADAYQGLLDLGVDVAGIVASTGRSESTVRRRLSLVALPAKARDALHSHEATLEDAATIAEIPDEKERQALAEQLGTPNFRMALQRVREQLERVARVKPLLDALAAVSAKELKANDWGSPAGSVQLTTIHVRYTSQEAVDERLKEVLGDVAEGWSFRWYYDDLVLYRPMTSEEQAETEAREQYRTEQERAAQESTAALKARRAELEQFAATTAATRQAFLEGLIFGRKSLTTAQQTLVVEYVADQLVSDSDDGEWLHGEYRPRFMTVGDRTSCVPWVRPQLPDGYADLPSWQRDGALRGLIEPAAALLSVPQRLLAMAAAASEPLERYAWEESHRCPPLRRWYGLLEQLGYPVSDAERERLVPAPPEVDDVDGDDETGDKS